MSLHTVLEADLTAAPVRTLPRFAVAAHGIALGADPLSNRDLANRYDVAAEWIERRCGIRSRQVAAPGETTHSLAAAAGRQAIANAGGCDPDVVILATFTPDRQLCPSAPSVADAIGLNGVGAFDLNAACTGGVAGLLTAASLLTSGMAERVLFIAADAVSRHLAPGDLSTRMLFGDGAAAFVLDRPSTTGATILATAFGSDGRGADWFHKPTGDMGHVQMVGPKLYRFAVATVPGLVRTLCERARIEPRDVDHVIVHQANLRMIRAIAAATGVPGERWFINLPTYGNTAAASVPIALAECLAGDGIRPGAHVVVVGFGAGLSWAGAVLQWG